MKTFTGLTALLVACGALHCISCVGRASGQTLAVANGTGHYENLNCGAVPDTPLVANERLIYDSRYRLSWFSARSALQWQHFNIDNMPEKWVTAGSFCRPGALTCLEGDTAQNDFLVSPYFGDISTFAPLGLIAVRFDIEYQMRCTPSITLGCPYNIIPMSVWPLQSQQPVTNSTISNFKDIFYTINPGAALSAKDLTDTPRLTAITYYQLPVNAQGFYVGMRSRGACFFVSRFRVSYRICMSTAIEGIRLGETVAGAGNTRYAGVCNATQDLAADPGNNAGVVSAECTPDGAWTSVLGQCVCMPAFGRLDRSTPCIACRTGFYKAVPSDSVCVQCPLNSDSGAMSASCQCMPDFYRNTRSVGGGRAEPVDVPCTSPPSQLQPGQIMIENATARAVEIGWTKTGSNGSRNDVAYSVSYQAHGASQWTLLPGQFNSSSVLSTVVPGLAPYTNYSIRVLVFNGVSDEAGVRPSIAQSIRAQTAESVPGKPRSVRLAQLPLGMRVVFDPPSAPNGVVLGYLVALMQVQSTVQFNRTVPASASWADFDNLLNDSLVYSAKVSAFTSVGPGEFLLSENQLTPGMADFTPPSTTAAATTDGGNGGGGGGDSSSSTTVIIGAVCAGVIFVVIILIIVILLVYVRTRGRRNSPYNVSVARHDPAATTTPMVSFFRRRTSSTKSNATIDLSGNHIYSPTSTMTSQVNGVNASRQYVDPLIYADVTQALSEFTKEINPNFVSLKDPIGEGEFAHVWQGMLKVPGQATRVVAVKVLKDSRDYRIKNDFLMEACIMGQFQCPNIVALIGICSKERARPAMILTEFMDNGSLDHYLQKNEGKFQPKELVQMCSDAASGMEYLSGMNFIHRDLAARNVLVSPKRVCKVSDFGLSREADDDNAYEVKHGGKLPIRWTAPEAIQYRKFTTQSDVWSFGILLWEIMSYGERPYWDWGNSEVMEAVTQRKYRLPPPAGCPNVVHGLMLECWNKERTQRPTFTQIRRKVEALLENDLPAENLAKRQEVSHAAPVSSYSGIEDWLKSLQLSQYTENFTSCGYSQVSQCLDVTLDDLAMIGITLPAHQRKLLSSLESLKVYNAQLNA